MAIFKGKKETVALVLNRLGIVRFTSYLPCIPKLVVFNYHRIGSAIGNPYDDAVFSATPESFRNQLMFLRKHFDLPSLEEVVASSADGKLNLRRPTALITFDDGYRDNYDLALPILKECGVKATFFIPTGFVDNPQIPWWDRIAYAIKHTNVKNLELNLGENVRFDLSQMPKHLVVKKVLDAYKAVNGQGSDDFIQHLEHQANVSLPDDMAGRRWIVSWPEIREMISAGMSVGSHTHTHSILSGLEESVQIRELVESKAILEQKSGGTVYTLAYPVGSTSAFSEITKRAARTAGYKLAFSYYGGVNTSNSFDQFDMRRIGVELNETASLFRVRAILYRTLGSSL